MKFTITMKTPDAVDRAIDEYQRDYPPSSNEEADSQREFLVQFLSKWFEFDEAITIVFDTEAQTATVLRV